MIRAGSLRNKITIQRKSSFTSSLGEEIEVWSEIKETRAMINPIRGTESFVSENVLNLVDYYMMFRKTEVTPQDRIIFKSRIFDVINVLDFNMRGVKMIALVKERFGEVTDFKVRYKKDLVTYNGIGVTYGNI